MSTLNFIHLNAAGAGEVVKGLQQLLADFQLYYTNLRGFHWEIKGHGFFTLHSKFEELYDDAAEKVDEIAERILQLGGVPANKFSEYLKIAQVEEVSGVTCGREAVENILNTISLLIKEERELLEVASGINDESTVSLLSDYLKEQEKLVWMLVAFSSDSCEKK